MSLQMGSKIGFGDVFKVNNLSDGERFKMSLECGEFFGPGDMKVKVLPEDNRLLIEGMRTQRTGDTQVWRKITYEHELPANVNVRNLKAGWDPNDDVLTVEAPFLKSTDEMTTENDE